MDKIALIFSKVLNIPMDEINDSLSYNNLECWDSIRHMKIIACLEEEYGIEFETQDIIDMETIGKARAILEKYIGKQR